MYEHYRDLAKQWNWLKDTPNAVARIDPRLTLLITDKGSLTAALISLSQGDFRVRVLKQSIGMPYFHEQRALSRPLAKAAMIREVELLVCGTPVVYARSIVPLNLISKGRSGLANLGRTPLGHLLFKDGQIRVSKREFSTPNFVTSKLSARRTPYDYQGSTILVSEFFLPAIFDRLV